MREKLHLPLVRRAWFGWGDGRQNAFQFYSRSDVETPRNDPTMMEKNIPFHSIYL